MTGKALGSVALMFFFVVFVTAVLPNWIKQRDTGNKVVIAMDKCIDEEHLKSHGQSYLETVYRTCWMRAKSASAK